MGLRGTNSTSFLNIINERGRIGVACRLKPVLLPVLPLAEVIVLVAVVLGNPLGLDVLGISDLFTGDFTSKFELFAFEFEFTLSNCVSGAEKHSFTGEAGIDEAAVSEEAFDDVELKEYIELPDVDRDDVDTEAREDADVESRFPSVVEVEALEEVEVEKENDEEPYLDIVDGRRGVAFM